MEYRFDWRAEREPSWEDMVFWRVKGFPEEEDAVDALEGCNLTDIVEDARSSWVSKTGSGALQSLGSTRLQ